MVRLFLVFSSIEIISSLALALIFSAIAIVHIYWMAGGLWLSREALPARKDGTPLFIPSKLMTAAVALILLSFALVYVDVTLPRDILPASVLTWCLRLIPILFLVRAIGDFQYVGFFSKPIDTDFRKMDRKYYSPLCLAIAVLGFVMVLF